MTPRKIFPAAVLLLLLIAVPAAAQSQSFVYVALRGTQCTIETSTQSCVIPPAVVVLDAATLAVITRIPLDTALPPWPLAISPDGSRLYVISGALGIHHVLSVIDLRRHRLLATHRLMPPPTCDYITATVDSWDPELVFLYRQCSASEIVAFDTRSGLIGPAVTAGPGRRLDYLTRSSVPGRFFTLTSSAVLDHAPDVALEEYDGATGVRSAFQLLGDDVYSTSGMSLSDDRSRLYIVTKRPPPEIRPWYAPERGRVLVLDPRTLAIVRSYESSLRLPTQALEAGPTRRLYVFDQHSTPLSTPADQRVKVYDVPSGALLQNVPGHPDISTLSADGRFGFGHGTSDRRMLVRWDLGSMTSVGSTSLDSEFLLITATPPAAAACSYRLNTNHSAWGAGGGSSWVTLSTNCGWQASTTAPWVRLSAMAGDSGLPLTLTVDSNFTTANRSATLTIGGQMLTVTQAGFGSGPPFGVVDTPADGAAGVAGSIPVTGWALDDAGVARVQIFRDPVAGEPQAPVFIGDATFVEGSRPDVQQAFGNYPNSGRGGWGLMVLTNMLPYAGNGPYRLHAFADDVEGHRTLIGTKTITCSNATAALPFGTIDTPAQGETVSGTIVNFGWALTPVPFMIPLDGSTIDVLIDGIVVGHPVYNNPRSDIAGLFPGYVNSGGPVGHFLIDTRSLADGVHTIAWIVRDNGGRADGIGSRYFTVFNP